MMMHAHKNRMALALVLVITIFGGSAAAQDEIPSTTQDYDELFERFLKAARQERAPSRHSVDIGWMSDLALDVKARRVNDIVTVRVIENISGAGAADSALAKSSSGLSSLSSFFGLAGGPPELD